MPYKDKEQGLKKHREYHKKWYKNNQLKKREQTQNRRKIISDFVHSLKIGKKCSRCSENDSRCLDFHHIDESTKEFAICDSIQKGFSIERIKKEIDKCEILCANCHRKEHR